MNDVVKANGNQGQTIIWEQSNLVKPEDFDDLGAGIQSSFPIIGYRMGRWRLRWQGEEQLITDERGFPVPEIGVSLVRVPDHKSKRYWAGGYDQNSRKAPDCWSNDSIRPDPILTPPAQPDGRPLPTQCSQCYWNSIGSMVSQDGKKKMKACGDYKRVAVKLFWPQIPIEELADMAMLLTIPASSLKPLKIYGIELKAAKMHAIARITYIGFEDDLSFPKFTFRPGPALPDDDYLACSALRQTEEVRAILNEESAALDPGATGVYAEEGQGEAVTAPPVQGAPSPTNRAPVQQTAPPQPTATVQRLKQATPPMQPTVQQAQPEAQPVNPSTRTFDENMKEIKPAIKYTSPSGQAQPITNSATTQRFAPAGRPIQPVKSNGAGQQTGGIAEAVSRPATPPPSSRPVVTASEVNEANPPPLTEVQLNAQSDAEERGTNLPEDVTAKFDRIMGG
jgi:hypothetical protein